VLSLFLLDVLEIGRQIQLCSTNLERSSPHHPFPFVGGEGDS
jgi:hypothetical protein